MFAWLNARSDLQRRALALHEAIVADARNPHLYATLKVPDTTDGRLELLALHVVLVLDRLDRAGEPGRKLAQAVTETYVTAMDDAMRAIGVGDLSVPRKVKKAAAMLYDRHRAYAPALAASPRTDSVWHDALTATLAPLEGAVDIDVGALAHYTAARADSLAQLPDDTLLAGRLTG